MALCAVRQASRQRQHGVSLSSTTTTACAEFHMSQSQPPPPHLPVFGVTSNLIPSSGAHAAAASATSISNTLSSSSSLPNLQTHDLQTGNQPSSTSALPASFSSYVGVNPWQVSSSGSAAPLFQPKTTVPQAVLVPMPWNVAGRIQLFKAVFERDPATPNTFTNAKMVTYQSIVFQDGYRTASFEELRMRANGIDPTKGRPSNDIHALRFSQRQAAEQQQLLSGLIQQVAPPTAQPVVQPPPHPVQQPLHPVQQPSHPIVQQLPFPFTRGQPTVTVAPQVQQAPLATGVQAQASELNILAQANVNDALLKGLSAYLSAFSLDLHRHDDRLGSALGGIETLLGRLLNVFDPPAEPGSPTHAQSGSSSGTYGLQERRRKHKRDSRSKKEVDPLLSETLVSADAVLPENEASAMPSSSIEPSTNTPTSPDDDLFSLMLSTAPAGAFSLVSSDASDAVKLLSSIASFAQCPEVHALWARVSAFPGLKSLELLTMPWVLDNLYAVHGGVLIHWFNHALDTMQALSHDPVRWDPTLVEKLNLVYCSTLRPAVLDPTAPIGKAWTQYRTMMTTCLDDAGFDAGTVERVLPVNPAVPVPLLTASYVEDLNAAWKKVDGPLKEIARWFEPFLDYGPDYKRAAPFHDATLTLSRHVRARVANPHEVLSKLWTYLHTSYADLQAFGASLAPYDAKNAVRRGHIFIATETDGPEWGAAQLAMETLCSIPPPSSTAPPAAPADASIKTEPSSPATEPSSPAVPAPGPSAAPSSASSGETREDLLASSPELRALEATHWSWKNAPSDGWRLRMAIALREVDVVRGYRQTLLGAGGAAMKVRGGVRQVVFGEAEGVFWDGIEVGEVMGKGKGVDVIVKQEETVKAAQV
ncbi:hypothetical protein OF83DRAFT_1292686 [Amylostereum chailletii]|nr:hypothetical protein OF83DRAFT_1292686 [Amylostereum chailletii]